MQSLGAIGHRRISLSMVAVTLVLLAIRPLARAPLIIVDANSPSLTDALDITLTNTGSGSVTLGGFSFGISVTDSQSH